MRFSAWQLGIVLLGCSLATGCGLNTAVLQKGGNDRMGVLLNYSCGASPCDPIDPTKPTIVITHGWNPAPKLIHCSFGSAAAAALKCRCGDSYNILSWDWNGVHVPALGDGPVNVGKEQGRMMAAALRCRGIVPCRTQIISHSLGTVVTAQAAACLADLGPFCQLTLLDPPESMHEEIFDRLCITSHAHSVENYWIAGVSGYGAHVNRAGVRNYQVFGAPHPVVGIVDLGLSNHVYVMRWYYETMRCPSMRYGFQNSALLCYCGGGGPCCPRCSQGAPSASDSEELDANGDGDGIVHLDMPSTSDAGLEQPATEVAAAPAGVRVR